MRSEKRKVKPRRYPAFWERAVPVIVVIIGILVLALVLVAASVALGFFPIRG